MSEQNKLVGMHPGSMQILVDLCRAVRIQNLVLLKILDIGWFQGKSDAEIAQMRSELNIVDQIFKKDDTL